MAHDCIKTVNAKLKDRGWELETDVAGVHTCMSLVRTRKGAPRVALVPDFCPFCGTPMTAAAKAKANAA